MHHSMMILTGAGISVASGLPAFTGPNGLYTMDDEAQSMFSKLPFMAKPALRRRLWPFIAASLTAKPSPAHMAIADLQRRGLVTSLITQNIDMSHEAAGSEARHVHGRADRAWCERCHAQYDVQSIIQHLDETPDPHCTIMKNKKRKGLWSCGGVIRPGIVFYGESLDADIMTSCEHDVYWCDELWVIGSSLSVYPVANLIDIALSMDKRIILFNDHPTAYDDRVSDVIRGDCQDAVVDYANQM
jgi:NAD-dependent deacetylase